MISPLSRFTASIFFILALSQPPALAGTASVSLRDASATLTQTSDTEWTLSKTGAFDTASSTVTWTIIATEVATVAGLLVVNGTITVTNSGADGATIGNVVVNLQTRFGNKWVTQSSDIADATQNDDATTANVVASASSENRSSFSENAASGPLLFMDAQSNTVFSLVPQPVIAPGATVKLLFSATFDNNVLGLATGTSARAETIVSFGNATPSGASSSNIDINGNGVIDPDEANVRSVPARRGVTVPAERPINDEVTLSDTVDDITTTGTVTFTDPVIDLGATSGTVTVTVDGGTDGGTITNCAHLTGSSSSVNFDGVTFFNLGAIDLLACDTQTIGPETCTPGAPGCGWQDGDVITHSQDSWGADPTPGGAAALLRGNYDSVYAPTSGVLEVGIPGTAGFSIRFTNADDLLNYLPALGTPGPLNSDHSNPLSTAAGAFGGEVTALQLNIDFSDAGVTLGASGTPFGNLTLCNFTVLPALNGTTVRQFLGIVNTLLGGGSAAFSIAQLDPLTNDLNNSFGNGTVSLFAQDHLVLGACP